MCREFTHRKVKSIKVKSDTRLIKIAIFIMQTLLYPCYRKVAEVFCRCTPNLCQGVHRLSATRWADHPHKDLPETFGKCCGHPRSISRHSTMLIFFHLPGTIFSAAWSQENQTRPLNSLSIASSYHSFPTQRGWYRRTAILCILICFYFPGDGSKGRLPPPPPKSSDEKYKVEKSKRTAA